MIENVLTFTTAVLILFTSLGIAQMCNWSVIHGIKRKPHLSVVWNWYHFVAIAILHQPRPTDSADINTRLQLSDTSSIPPMHGGFLLVLDHTIVAPNYNNSLAFRFPGMKMSVFMSHIPYDFQKYFALCFIRNLLMQVLQWYKISMITTLLVRKSWEYIYGIW